MARTRLSGIGDGEAIVGVPVPKDACARFVLGLCADILRNRVSERIAFDAAVPAYQGRNPNTVEQEACRAVAEIICGKGI